MTCRACQSAQAEPRADRWTPGCTSCLARAAACIGTLPTDAQALRRLFGPERLDEGREHFNRWASTLRQARARGATT